MNVGTNATTALLHELAVLREHVSMQETQIENLSKDLDQREEDNGRLEKELYLERFKYELMIDLVRQRVAVELFFDRALFF